MAALNQIGAQQLTVTNVAVALTVPTGKRPKHALIRINGTAGTNDIRWRADGTAPVASTGGQLAPGNSYIDWTDTTNDSDFFGLIKGLQMIREGGTSATVDIQYFD